MRVARWISPSGLGLLVLVIAGCGGAGTRGAERVVQERPDAGPRGDAGGAGDAGTDEPEGERLDPELLELLDELAVEREPAAIAELARALGKHEHPAAVARLITLLASEQERIRRAAIDSLEGLGAAAVEPLIGALDSGDPEHRNRVIDCLTTIGDPRAIPALIRILPATTESGSAARALTRFGDAAVPGLIEALESGTGATRVQAAAALEIMNGTEQITAALIDALSDEWAPVRRRAAAALGTHGVEGAVEPLSALLDDPDVEVRMAVAGAAGRIGGSASIELLDKALADEHERVRGAAVDAVGARKDPALVDKLYPTVADDHHDVRVKAREAIYTIVTHSMAGNPSREIVKRLVAILEDGEPAARASAAYLLGKLHAIAATKDLSRCLKDPDADVRFAALSALRDLENPASAKALVGALRDEDPQIRAGAAELLGMMEIKRAVGPLARLLRDPEVEVRRAAADALQSVPKRSAVGALIKALGDEDRQVSDSAWQVLLAIGAPATGKLVAAFKKRATGKQAREQIARLLGHQWKNNAVLALIGALRDPDDEIAELVHVILQDMTCAELGRDPAEWRRWWKKNKRNQSGECSPKGRKHTAPDPQEHPPIW